MKKELNEYLQVPFNYEVYEDLILEGVIKLDWLGVEFETNDLFEPIGFFELLYSELEKIKNTTNSNFIEFTSELIEGYKDFSIEQQLFFVHYLTYKINLEYPEHESNPKELKINKVFTYLCSWAINISKNHDSKKKTPPEKENKYNFQKVKQHIETLTAVKDKILYLIEIKTDFLQNKSGFDFEIGTTFDEKCELEIKKLNEVLKLETATATPKAKTVFKLSKKNGVSKVDLIRVLNALYELRYFEYPDGQIPTKKDYFEEFGIFLGVTLSDYHSNLSQALKNQPLEVNLKVFEEMKEAIQNAHYQTKAK